MFIIFVFFWNMFIMSLIMFAVSLIFYNWGLSLIFEWMIFEFNSMNLEIMILLDWLSLAFLSVVFLISSMIMLYSYMYMYGNIYILRFIYLVFLFVLSMLLMIISPNIISILFGWDGLGLISYCLVIFYQNYYSYNSGMVTVLCNRVGDIGLLLGISMLMLNGSWNFWTVESDWMWMSMLFIAGISKSAQIPFSTWLPMAMAAPTPVSALVHSSTLVTAGVYLMIRFSEHLIDSGISKMLFFISIITMFMSGFMANIENDLKKIIALSTLSQLGLMMMVLSMNMKMLAFYHLMTHALFKSMLFMCAGIFIHLMLDSQDIRLFGNLNEVVPFTMMSFYIASLSLCGYPFLSGFYSKDFIMEMVYMSGVNKIMGMLMILSLMLTVSYSFRLFYYMFFNNMKFYSYYSFKENNKMNMSMMSLVIFSVVSGSLLNWLFFYDMYFMYLSFFMKSLTLLFCMVGMILGFSVSKFNIFWKFYYFNYFLNSMMFLNYLFLWLYNPFIHLGANLSTMDLYWFDFLKKSIMKYLLLKNYMEIFKMFMFLLVFNLIIILFFLL